MDITPTKSMFDIIMMLNTKLKTTSNYTDAFDILLDAYKDIGNNLPQFEKYAQLFGRKWSVRKVLVEIFGGILKFHKRAIGFFRRSGMAFYLLFCLTVIGCSGSLSLRIALGHPRGKPHSEYLEDSGKIEGLKLI